MDQNLQLMHMAPTHVFNRRCIQLSEMVAQLIKTTEEQANILSKISRFSNRSCSTKSTWTPSSKTIISVEQIHNEGEIYVVIPFFFSFSFLWEKIVVFPMHDFLSLPDFFLHGFNCATVECVTDCFWKGITPNFILSWCLVTWKYIVFYK